MKKNKFLAMTASGLLMSTAMTANAEIVVDLEGGAVVYGRLLNESSTSLDQHHIPGLGNGGSVGTLYPNEDSTYSNLDFTGDGDNSFIRFVFADSEWEEGSRFYIAAYGTGQMTYGGRFMASEMNGWTVNARFEYDERETLGKSRAEMSSSRLDDTFVHAMHNSGAWFKFGYTSFVDSYVMGFDDNIFWDMESALPMSTYNLLTFYNDSELSALELGYTASLGGDDSITASFVAGGQNAGNSRYALDGAALSLNPEGDIEISDRGNLAENEGVDQMYIAAKFGADIMGLKAGLEFSMFTAEENEDYFKARAGDPNLPTRLTGAPGTVFNTAKRENTVIGLGLMYAVHTAGIDIEPFLNVTQATSDFTHNQEDKADDLASTATAIGAGVNVGSDMIGNISLAFTQVSYEHELGSYDATTSTKVKTKIDDPIETMAILLTYDKDLTDQLNVGLGYEGTTTSYEGVDYFGNPQSTNNVKLESVENILALQAVFSF